MSLEDQNIKGPCVYILSDERKDIVKEGMLINRSLKDRKRNINLLNPNLEAFVLCSSEEEARKLEKEIHIISENDRLTGKKEYFTFGSSVKKAICFLNDQKERKTKMNSVKEIVAHYKVLEAYLGADQAEKLVAEKFNNKKDDNIEKLISNQNQNMILSLIAKTPGGLAKRDIIEKTKLTPSTVRYSLDTLAESGKIKKTKAKPRAKDNKWEAIN